MRPFSTPAPQRPTRAERVRSVLLAAHSMSVVTDGRREEVRRLEPVGVMGHMRLHAPGDEAQATAGERVPVRMEFTDIAPTAVRDRVRARVTVTGLLTGPYRPDATEITHVEFGQAVIEDAAGRAYVTLDELEAASADPLATAEASMLTHLVDDHAELVPLLLRLVPDLRTTGLLRALPVAMDRYGITLRLEYALGHDDVPLPFASPLTDIDQAGPRIHGLFAAARRLSHGNRLPA
ncbi:DUF2470 domain-containing protein [Streptomyces sp. NBC_00239]|uniref:DUF2470 domain-containing protein n=1 Tax=Streptomyces sp. NBC_00239 TaxID=2903640 RepID=UPI002E27CA8D|nr:DUF2470 domain-containing protein [Streptomyces sp. NBC_00239]